MTIPNPLNADQKTHWLAELRYGEWKQCQNQLRRGGSHNSLGVLAELLGKLDEDGSYRGWSMMTLHTSDGPEVLPSNVQDELVIMDYRGVSFAEIADWIEANVEVS